jgi:spore maturation protein CgeB
MMNLIVFGLSVSSSWGNGHATLWRGLIRALAAEGHRVTFYERDAPYYAAHRDYDGASDCELVLYDDLAAIRGHASAALRSADVAIITSYCPDAVPATELVMESAVPIRAFYDLDTPITLERLRCGEPVAYIGPGGLRDFDLVMSYTGGPALSELQRVLGARLVAPLYGSVDPRIHAPVAPIEKYRADLSYLGTYAAERQASLVELFLEPARALPEQWFAIGGSLYPHDFAWMPNLKYLWHVPPAEHPAFYCSALLNLNVTRAPMAAMGYCPSGRLFEAAACGAAMITDYWPGLEEFYEPGAEILVARDRSDVLEALQRSPSELQTLARRARERTLEQHTIEHRAQQMLEILSTARAATRALEREAAASMEL